MKRRLKFIFPFLLFLCCSIKGQSLLNIYPDSLSASVNTNLTPGVFYVPKTSAAAIDFVGNGIHQNSIRTNVIESVLNNTSNLSSCLSLLSTVQTDLQTLSLKCDKFIFIFEKMPPWLSSSSDGSPAATPGWSVLNTKPPANWNTWQTVVDSITSRIVNQFGITNAYFEIWNEPDLGSWTGTMSEYFLLYKKSFDGIKAANSSAKVGGPAVNFWANNINWQAPYGYISNTKADSSLIGQLLDSSVIWNKVPDFISWHNFNLSYQEFGNASNYIQQKLVSLSLPTIPLIVSEWNAPSQVRDTRLATSFLIKAQLELCKTSVSNNAIAAWQDFNNSTVEFHNDYGLLTYGAIHKPSYNGILLSEMVEGTKCKMISSDLFDGISSVVNDTLFLLISNYCPPAFLEAFNYTLYQGHFNAFQLDSAGYINIVGNYFLHLDSIYKGLIAIPNTTGLEIAINNSIVVYQHYQAIETFPRNFNLNINGYTGNYAGQVFIVDSTQNNFQYRYDSLVAAGNTQASAISIIIPNQSINFSSISVVGGQYPISLQSNAVCLLKINIPGLNSMSELNSKNQSFSAYPNPSSETITIVYSSPQIGVDELEIYNAFGEVVKKVEISDSSTLIDISELASGIYFIQSKNRTQSAIKFIKQ